VVGAFSNMLKVNFNDTFVAWGASWTPSPFVTQSGAEELQNVH